MVIYAPAKLNLCLDILKKRADGYHEIRTVFQRLDFIRDTIKIDETKEDDHTSIENHPQKNTYTRLPEMEKNLAHRALKLFKKHTKITRNFKISIHKNIPLSSGLGGASSDAASVLTALNELTSAFLVREDLVALGANLGADVPFFISGHQTALGTSLGDKITPLPNIENLHFELLPEAQWPLPKFIENKTREMYENLDISLCGQNTDKTEKLLVAIKKQDAQQIIASIHNDFEQYYEIPANAHLSGSGPSLFIASLS